MKNTISNLYTYCFTFPALHFNLTEWFGCLLHASLSPGRLSISTCFEVVGALDTHIVPPDDSILSAYTVAYQRLKLTISTSASRTRKTRLSRSCLLTNHSRSFLFPSRVLSSRCVVLLVSIPTRQVVHRMFSAVSTWTATGSIWT
jgi:hypothetical protein